MGAKLISAVDELKNLSAGRRIKTPSPDDNVISEYEKEVGFSFSDEYRFFLKEASAIFFGVVEPLVLTRERNDRSELRSAVIAAREIGLPHDWLPICEDNGDYYCIIPDGKIRFWSPDGVATESWADLAEWVSKVWISRG
ncbi:SMI1/KNR4 family protein [Burkholderia vietnamiensis]|uniref:SMI1/KNR4 family protein n=1 Tax=Burkholderia vietnamiensis TaxID=60552 RepID=UPI0009BE6F63|nr:SMI1/KNR4 family protein [Burkholderia vietnamiensis]